MKNKKLLALLLAIMMVVSVFAATSFASATSSDITNKSPSPHEGGQVDEDGDDDEDEEETPTPSVEPSAEPSATPAPSAEPSEEPQTEYNEEVESLGDYTIDETAETVDLPEGTDDAGETNVAAVTETTTDAQGNKLETVLVVISGSQDKAGSSMVATGTKTVTTASGEQALVKTTTIDLSSVITSNTTSGKIVLSAGMLANASGATAPAATTPGTPAVTGGEVTLEMAGESFTLDSEIVDLLQSLGDDANVVVNYEQVVGEDGVPVMMLTITINGTTYRIAANAKTQEPANA